MLVSGHGGNSSGGSEVVWQIGGLMVYVSILVLLSALVFALSQRLRGGAHLRSR